MESSRCSEGTQKLGNVLSSAYINKDELQKLRSDFIILVARVLKEFFGFLDSLKGTAVPEHIPHRYN